MTDECARARWMTQTAMARREFTSESVRAFVGRGFAGGERGASGALGSMRDQSGGETDEREERWGRRARAAKAMTRR